ncbi:MAG: hypothetical protein LBK58_03965 [Prevotellaceae bacterium]|jgi:hypothetical protein|nr:hypothetical protein [Prevotellaceae bacterium]
MSYSGTVSDFFSLKQVSIRWYLLCIGDILEYTQTVSLAVAVMQAFLFAFTILTLVEVRACAGLLFCSLPCLPLA